MGAEKLLQEVVEILAYDPKLFAAADDEADGRPVSECCCCSEAYRPGSRVARTPCGHHFHRGCLVTWLRQRSTCPLCRLDLRALAEARNPVVDDYLVY